MYRELILAKLEDDATERLEKIQLVLRKMALAPTGIEYDWQDDFNILTGLLARVPTVKYSPELQAVIDGFGDIEWNKLGN
jgi:hypothetical protein